MERTNIKFELMSDKAVLPTKGTAKSAGFDLTAIDYELIDVGMHGVVWFHTRLKVEIPQDYFGGIYIRSGLAKKGKWTMTNNVGIIDNDYRGELIVMLRYVSGGRFIRPRVIKEDMKELIETKIAQLVIQPYHSNLIIKKGKVRDTKRGDGGFGHTDE